MQRFTLNGLAEWLPLSPDEIIAFPGKRSGRTVTFTVNAPNQVQVYAAHDESMAGEVLVAVGVGLMEISIAARDELFIVVRSLEGCGDVFVKTNTPDQRVEKMSFEKFTTIETRRARNPEIDAMMATMRFNEQQRENRMKAEIAAMHEAFNAKLQQQSGTTNSEPKEQTPATGTVAEGDVASPDTTGTEGGNPTPDEPGGTA